MRRITILSILFASFFMPAVVFAETGSELVSSSPAIEDISDQALPSPAPGENDQYVFIGEIGETYDLAFTVTDECPVIALLLGGTMTADANWSCDADARTMTASFTITDMVDPFEGNVEEGSAIVSMSFTYQSTDPMMGPTAADAGIWMNTDVQQWQMVYPNGDNPRFGFSLTGPAGETGYFKMFIPAGLIDQLGQFSGQTLEPSDLAVFNGNQQSSLSITEVNGGALVEIDVVFTETNFTASDRSVSSNSGSVTKTISAGEQLDISLTAEKTRIKKNKETTLFGWVKDAKEGQKVKIRRAKKGGDFKLWQTVTTDEDGYFEIKVKSLEKPTRYKATTKMNDNSYTASTVTIRRK